MITVQKVTKDNESKIKEFVKKEWKKFDKEKGYEYDLEKLSFAAYENKKIVGFFSAEITGGAAYLSELLVEKSIRRKGVGEILIKKFEEIAKKRKCHVAFLQTSAKHAEALKFYKKNGYKIIATLPNHKFHFTWYMLSKELTK